MSARIFCTKVFLQDDPMFVLFRQGEFGNPIAIMTKFEAEILRDEILVCFRELIEDVDE